jgi:hypothetical protein
MENIDKQEVKKFSDLAEEWWNEKEILNHFMLLTL